jgi:hypothetical protein
VPCRPSPISLLIVGRSQTRGYGKCAALRVTLFIRRPHVGLLSTVPFGSWANAPKGLRCANGSGRNYCSEGVTPQTGIFCSRWRERTPKAIDAATLQLCVMGLPVDLQTMRKTRLAVQRALGRGDFLLRYTGEDGLPGQEGAFLVCSLWLVDALLAEGELEAATRLFERLLRCANDVGLYAEQIDPQSGAFLGNFPQAFTHLGLLNTAVSLALFNKGGQPAVRGGYAERARKSVRATFGWRGVAAAFLSTGRIRLFSSRASKLSMNNVRVPH